jgi:hypothetical protein
MQRARRQAEHAAGCGGKVAVGPGVSSGRRAAASAVAGGALLAMMAASSTAGAQTIIKTPGQHPQGPELEPHLVLRPFDTFDNDLGLGLGFRATFQIGRNNFIGNINNSVGVGVGLDWTRYRGCKGYYRYDEYYNCDKVNVFTVPVVMQWSFYITKSWSVFGEPGIALSHYSWDDCDNAVYYDKKGRPYNYYCHDNRRLVDPVFFVGGRWHFADNVTLTMRLGWPFSSVGVSFM